ncbi:hypothetical protein [Luteolibacter marinus]|uniref:hypothetical protein n=1 Tax=Luteolibacter marinus TaxID=2776705 RepID=UPI0018693BAE|nr:hypothetical protein [Luteolibacter marinus]
MSDREKKLVFLFGLAAFVLLNVFAFTWFKNKKADMAIRLGKAQDRVIAANETADMYDTVIDEMDWMVDHMPEPKAGQIVATALEQYASNQAQTHQLTIKRRAILPNEETGAYFHQAKVEFNVTGREDSLYRWLDRLQMPDQLRAVTFMRLSPDKDDTLIDCTVHAAQWYVPPSDDAGADVEPETEEVPEAGAAPVPETPPALPPGLPKPPGTE